MQIFAIPFLFCSLAGISRSVTIAAAYIICVTPGLSVSEALQARTIPILRQQRDWVGVMRRLAIFADVQCYLCWRWVGGWVGWWVRKSLKMYWCNIGMVPAIGYSQLTYHRQSKFWIPEATLRFWGQWWSTKGQYYMPKGKRRLFWALFFCDKV